MRSLPAFRAVLLLSTVSVACTSAQLSLAQTAVSAQAPTTVPKITGTASGALPQTGRRSEVRYVDGLLTVSANNASLNGLIREIARRTGMRVTGSVTEDRVFGTYGPADPGRVLLSLLDGTGSNLLIVQDSSDKPRELVLTARTGAATPPNPNATAQNDTDEVSDTDDAPVGPQPMRRGAPSRSMLPRNAPNYVPPAGPVPQGQNTAQQEVGGPDRNPAATAPSSTEQPVVFPPVDATTPSATASSTPADTVDSTPKDAKTPQQIFEQLQKMRQQNQQPAPQ